MPDQGNCIKNKPDAWTPLLIYPLSAWPLASQVSLDVLTVFQ